MRKAVASKRAQLDGLARLERQERVVAELVLLDLVAQQAARQRRGVDRHARELRQHVGQAADVVLVGVRDEEGLDLVAALLEVGDVGHDEVDAEHLLVGEHQPAVDDDDLVAVLEDVHVLADLAHAAERDDAQDRSVAAEAGVARRGMVRRTSSGSGHRRPRGRPRARCRRRRLGVESGGDGRPSRSASSGGDRRSSRGRRRRSTGSARRSAAAARRSPGLAMLGAPLRASG